MSSLYRVIPESSQVRLPACSPGCDSMPALPSISDSVALRAVRFPRSRNRNASCNRAARRRIRAALIPAQMRRGMHAEIDAACVLRLSNLPMPFTGEA